MALTPRRERAVRVALPQLLYFLSSLSRRILSIPIIVYKNLQAPARRDGNSYPRDKRRPRRIGFPARVGRSTAWTWSHQMHHAWITSRAPDVSPNAAHDFGWLAL